jgi:ABC-2 type transport system permease protein
VLIASPLVGVPLTPVGFVLSLLALTSIALGIGGIGLALAWKIDSVQGFHGVMNLVLMPMWLLSGAVFPLTGSAGWMSWIMRLNPLTWGSEALRWSLAGGPGAEGASGLIPAWAAWAGAACFAAAGVAMAAAQIDRRRRRNIGAGGAAMAPRPL